MIGAAFLWLGVITVILVALAWYAREQTIPKDEGDDPEGGT
jgi:hypothetical protein